jgi:S1-C subfamily serine protease
MGLQPARLSSGGSIILGDVIQAIDGKATNSLEELTAILDEYDIGDEVELRVWRNAEVIALRAELVAAPQ